MLFRWGETVQRVGKVRIEAAPHDLVGPNPASQPRGQHAHRVACVLNQGGVVGTRDDRRARQRTQDVHIQGAQVDRHALGQVD
ncbi:MAG: hypothetical protein A2792_16945 [Sphingomonadales bacterium RIFCSPHIGHO2_01_FULL_65_20]|nr:MAG: hypothetical protein A2792_16945 [Sphingomonadales bacterium RIFCSPHIGHO2_01_FULL_65_20]